MILAANGQPNWYSIATIGFVGMTSTIVLVKFIQSSARATEKRRKQVASKLARRTDRNVRAIVDKVLSRHMRAERRQIKAIMVRLDNKERSIERVLERLEVMDRRFDAFDELLRSQLRAD